MYREIEFKGEAEDGKIVYGDLSSITHGITSEIVYYIYDSEIKPDSVKQFTGVYSRDEITQKKTEKIWEGDTVEYYSPLFLDNLKAEGAVEFQEGGWVVNTGYSYVQLWQEVAFWIIKK